MTKSPVNSEPNFEMMDSAAEAAETSESAESSSPRSKSSATDKPRESGKLADANSALNAATSLREKAHRAGDRKDYGRAFDLMSQAWATARSHPKDARLTQLADEIAAELDELGMRANSKFSKRAGDPNTKLIDK